jgi:hypothetical protein
VQIIHSTLQAAVNKWGRKFGDKHPTIVVDVQGHTCLPDLVAAIKKSDIPHIGGYFGWVNITLLRTYKEARTQMHVEWFDARWYGDYNG